MNYCKRCETEIKDGEILCEQCKKHQFHFGESIQQNIIIQTDNKPSVEEEEKKEIIAEETVEENVEIEEPPREETEYEKYKKINYIPDKPEEYISLELPGGHDSIENPFLEIKKMFSEFKNSFSGKRKFQVKKAQFTKGDFISAFVMLGSIVGIGILIFISLNIVYDIVSDKKTEINEEIIEVFVDENAPYYHYLDCEHIIDGKRYVKLEEYIAKELGYIRCKKGD